MTNDHEHASGRSALAMDALLAAIVDSSDDAILSKDLDGTVLSWNAGAERLYGYTAAEIVGRQISVIVPADHGGEVDHILERIRAGRRIEHFETERVAKDGSVVPVSVTISPVRDATGRIVGASTIARDISERKRLEAELQNARDQAMEASRLKSDFLATMSHEIRTPMNGVIGMTGMLLDTELDPQQREYAETVRRSAEALLTIINDILDFSKIEAGRLDLEAIDFDLRTLVQEVAELLAEVAHAKGLELATAIDAELTTSVRADAGRLRQILINLVGNAVKYTERGEVVVRVGLARESEREALVRFEVSDTGPGISAESRATLFEPFRQGDASTTRSHGGTGLGLAIAKKLTELMGGSLDVDSELGRGSTFAVTVPLEKRPQRQAAESRRRPELRDLRVLIVDDNATNRKILEHQVASWSMRPTSVDGGTPALEVLRDAAATAAPYDLVLLDMEMPGMDGLELARAIRSEPALAAIPLLLLTSSGLRGSAEAARQARISAFLTKPVRQSQLYDAIATVMGAAPLEAPFVTRQTISEARARGRPRLLVAEDNQVNQQVAVAMLTKLGYRADVVSDGAEAVDALSRVSYGAVLMDCQMPEMDGYAATAEIRARESGGHVPIIAMTASAMKGERERCLAAGMDDYISKPVDLDRLAEVLGRWVASEDDVEAAGEHERVTTGPFDQATVDALRLLTVEGGRDTFDALAEMFLDDTPARVATLREAIDRGDIETARREAHTLKGSAGNVGAMRLAEGCAEIETLAASGPRPPDQEAVDRVEAEFDRARAWLEPRLRRQPDGRNDA